MADFAYFQACQQSRDQSLTKIVDYFFVPPSRTSAALVPKLPTEHSLTIWSLGNEISGQIRLPPFGRLSTDDLTSDPTHPVSIH